MLDMILTGLACQVLAPWMLLGLPSTHGLTVTRIQDLPEGVHPLLWERYVNENQEWQPALRVLWVNQDPVSIDPDREQILHADWQDLLGGQHMGSAAIGIVLLGLPGVLLTSPIWVSAQTIWWIMRQTGWDQHRLAAYLKLQGQLSQQDRRLLWRALRAS